MELEARCWQVHGLLQIAADAKHPGRLKALELIANRVGFSEKQQIEITHRDLTGDALLERIQYLSNMPLSSEVKLPDTNAFTHPAIIEHRAAEPSDNLDPSLDPNSAAADRRQNRLGGTISESAETAHISRTDRPDKKSLPDLENRRNQAGVRRSVGEPVVGQEIERRRMRRRGARVRLLPVIVVEEAADRQPTPADESCAKQANRAAARNQDSPIIRAHSASLSNRAKVRDKPRDKPVRQHRFLDRRRGESEERRPSTHRDNR